MKKILIFIVLSSITIYASSTVVMPSDVINMVKVPIEHWHGQFVNMSWSVFRYLMFFEMILLFGLSFLRGGDIGSLFADLIKVILIFGFFSWLIYATYDLSKILKGYTWMANQVGGGVDVDEGFKKIINMIIKLWKKASIWKPGEAVLLSLIIIVSAGVFFILLGQIIKNYIFSIISIYGSSLFFAFGAFTHTRQYAINAFVNIFRYGAKYLFMLLVVDLGLIILGNALSSDAKIKDLAMTLFAVIVIKEIAEGVEGFVDGIFSGMGSSGGSVISGYMQRSGNAVGGAAVGAVTGLAGGAKGGYSAIKEAAAAGGDGGGGKSASIKTAMKAGAGGLAGAAAGATTGAIKGAFGKADQGTGQGSGAFAAKSAGTLIKGGMAVANAPSKAGEKTGEAIQNKMNKDRNGFDMNQLKKDSSTSTGEIKGA